MGKPTKILHNVAVGVVLNDVLDPLIAVLISAKNFSGGGVNVRGYLS